MDKLLDQLFASLLDAAASRLRSVAGEIEKAASGEFEAALIQAITKGLLLLLALLGGMFCLGFVGCAVIVAVPPPDRWIPALILASVFGLLALLALLRLRALRKPAQAPAGSPPAVFPSPTFVLSLVAVEIARWWKQRA